MSATYVSGTQEETRAGGVILVIASSMAAVLLIAGLAYALGTGQRHMAALAAAGCELSLSPSGLPCTTVQMLQSEYTEILTPDGTQLAADRAAYGANEEKNLAAAEAVLTAEVTTERAFDIGLAGITFPPAITPIAKALFMADQARASLTAQQAQSSSLTQMRSFDHRVQAASVAVQTQLTLLNKALDRG